MQRNDGGVKFPRTQLLVVFLSHCDVDHYMVLRSRASAVRLASALCVRQSASRRSAKAQGDRYGTVGYRRSLMDEQA